MKLRAMVLAACWPLLGCAAMPTLTERPEEYRLFRAARVAPTLEERLGAAHRYLREVPGGRHTQELRKWFDAAEPLRLSRRPAQRSPHRRRAFTHRLARRAQQAALGA